MKPFDSDPCGPYERVLNGIELNAYHNEEGLQKQNQSFRTHGVAVDFGFRPADPRQHTPIRTPWSRSLSENRLIDFGRARLAGFPDRSC
ncbi:MAG: hypothetical protein ACRER2_18275 [Methylococcales bacterium]